MDTIFVTGHQRPDTDSIASSIAYAYLLRQQGRPAVACRAGAVNPETAWVLDRFGLQEPELLQDADFLLGQIEVDAPRILCASDMVFDALQLMDHSGHDVAAVVDEDDCLCGILSRRDISRIGLQDTAAGIQLLSVTPLSNLVRSISGTLLADCTRLHLNGKVSMIASNVAGARKYDVQDRIVISGDDPAVQRELILKGAGLLVLVWTESVEQDILDLAKQHDCPVVLSGHGAMNTARYLYFAVPVGLLMEPDVQSFSRSLPVREVQDRMSATRHRSFPVVDGDGHVTGFVERWHLLSRPVRNMVLVDHNEFSQSVPGVERARILEVIDHHRVSGFHTSLPVAMRCELTGSTATIIARMFRERSVPIPPDIAGLLLGAVLSDTLAFRSPTTSQEDMYVGHFLASVAGVDLDDFARDLFACSGGLDQQDAMDLLTADMKEFEAGDGTYRISQIISWDLDGLSGRFPELLSALEALSASCRCTCIVVCTSISKKGSFVLCAGPDKARCDALFSGGRWVDGLLSRKLQVVPRLSEPLFEKF